MMSRDSVVSEWIEHSSCCRSESLVVAVVIQYKNREVLIYLCLPCCRMATNEPKFVILVHDSDSESEREKNVKETKEMFKNKNPFVR